jgi:predicted 2-oxoglutarate/Fe(II)-dependent dioxygenase YbiX/peroxiredoxin
MNQPVDTSHRYVAIQPGDPAPWFHQRSTSHPRYAFDTVGGRYVVMLFLGTASDPHGRAAMQAVLANGDLFDDDNFCFFGVTIDPADESESRLRDRLPGIRHFWDFDGEVSRRYGAIPVDAKPGSQQVSLRRFWMVLDPMLRAMATFPFAADGQHQAVFDYLRALPPRDRFGGIEIGAPVIVLPNVFEPELCKRLIHLYDMNGGESSGFMQEVDGKTVMKQDANRKVRKDYLVEDEEVIKLIQRRVQRRIAPEILKVHQFNANRMERYIVACYSAEDGGHFFMHRDNTTKGTAHRRFAVSINLNNDFDGGELSFPEYNRKSIKIPTGTAVVFSCSLLHQVSKVTRGRRYAFLPFLYDDAAAKVREANNIHLGEGVSAYRGA